MSSILFFFSTAAWHAVSYSVLHNYMSLKQTNILGLAKRYITYFWLYPENNWVTVIYQQRHYSSMYNNNNNVQ